MFRQEDYLVFDKSTNEKLKIVSVNMHTDDDTDVVVLNENEIVATKKLADLHVFEKMFELCGDALGNVFNVYTWDVVKNNRTGKMYTVLTKNVVIETGDDFETQRYLSDKEIEDFDDTLTEDTFVRLGNMYDKQFENFVNETRKQKKIEDFAKRLSVGCVIHTECKGLNKEYRYMLVSRMVGVDKIELYLVNMNGCYALPTFVGKEPSEAIEFLMNVLKHEIVDVEKV